MKSAPDPELAWSRQPRAARIYVAFVIALGVVVLFLAAPRALPSPGLFVLLVGVACLTSAWKVNLPIALASGSTLSVAYAADIMALLLLGPRLAIVIAAIGVWMQCTMYVKRWYPLYRTAFSMAAGVLTMAVSGVAFRALGGGSLNLPGLIPPVVGAIVAGFSCNTGLVAAVIALSTGRSMWRVWCDDFLWSVTSFFVVGSAGAIAAVVVQRGQHWNALLLLAPVYLAYQTYGVFTARLEDQRRHLEELTRLEEERRALLERERAARESAEAANRLKDQFLATVSHELRTPMNAILGWADMLRLGTLPDDRRARACEAIFNNAVRQARLIDELLDMARIVAGKLQLECATIDPREIAASALETVQMSAEAKRIRIEMDVDPTFDALHADGTRLGQVLWNLLANAIKFTPEGGSVHLRMARRDAWGEIVVSDSGMGIPGDFLPSVFEPFRQADGSVTREHDGLGLGLAIVQQVVVAHRGTIEVDSAGPGRGATFTVRLPLAGASALDDRVDGAEGTRTRQHDRPGEVTPGPQPLEAEFGLGHQRSIA